MKLEIKNRESIITHIWRGFLALFSAVSAIAISTLVVLNSTWLYSLIIEKYNLTKITGVAKEGLIKDYNGLIQYLENPFIEKLKFDNFAMSTYGEIHFYEVKRIFLALIVIVMIFLLGIIVWSILSKNNKYNIDKLGLIKNLNCASNVLGGFFIVITACYFIDFSWAFTIFHKIFFRNDYWIFDPAIDPVILALPEDLFMICGALILGILILGVIAIKWAYYKKVKTNSKKSVKTSLEM